MPRIELRATAVPALADEILGELRARANADNVAGMARFGISSEGTLGVTVPVSRALAAGAKRALGRGEATDAERHELAAKLWASRVHEARLVAAYVDVPALVTSQQMDAWAADFDSWDICDGVTTDLFDASPLAWTKVAEWSGDDREFVKRGAFSLIAGLASHSSEEDAAFLGLLPLVAREAGDPRNFVKKAVNRALRNIGKRSLALNAAAVECAQRILAAGEAVKPATPESRAQRWVARDALRELTNAKTVARIRR